MATLKECPIDRETFANSAKPVPVVLPDRTLHAAVKHFSSGSFGFYACDKIVVLIGGVPVPCQVNLSITAIGSKPKE